MALTLTLVPGVDNVVITVVPVVTGATYNCTITAMGAGAPVSTSVLVPGVPNVRPATGVNPRLTANTDYVVDVREVVAGAQVDAGTGTFKTLAATAGPTPVLLEPPKPTLDALTFIDADVRNFLTQATRIGLKWRSEFLSQEARGLATQAATFDDQITALQAMDLSKVIGAEQLLTPFLLDAMQQIERMRGRLEEQIGTIDITNSSKTIADAALELILLQKILAFLADRSMLAFWIGLLGRLIDDIAAFDASLSRTEDYVRQQVTDTELGPIVQSMVAGISADVLAEVDALSSPIRAAVGEYVEKMAGGARDALGGFDETLLVSPGATPSDAGVPNADPFMAVGASLRKSVDDALAQLRDEARAALDAALKNLAVLSDLFTSILMTYVVLPLLSALIVAIAGGPLAAAILAAAVAVAAEELVHLLARWLSGPLGDQVNAARAKLDQAVDQTKQILAMKLAPIGRPFPAQPQALEILGQELRSLRDTLPRAYLDSAAAILGEARDVLLRRATQLALAAEYAAGLETGTGFDRIAFDYARRGRDFGRVLGASSPGHLAAVALGRDLAHLQAERLDLLDGKEMEITERLSLFRMLGGTGDPLTATTRGLLDRLFRGEEIAVRLSEEMLLGRQQPGLYRALISELRITGVFDEAPVGVFSSISIPIQVRHLGLSRTRVRTNANFSPARTRRAARLGDQEFGQGLYSQAVDTTLASGAGTPATVLRSRAGDLEPLILDSEVAVIVNAYTQLLPGLPAGSSPSDRLAFFRAGRTSAGVNAGEGLIAAAARAHRRMRARIAGAVGKLADIALEEDPDPRIGALGFATLVRDLPPESAAFNLVPRLASAATTTATAPEPAAALPLLTSAAAQKRPFADRGLDGVLTLRIPAAELVAQGDISAGAMLTMFGLPGADARPQLVDVVLDVTYRACFDANLAAAQQSARAQRRATRTRIAQQVLGAGAQLVTTPPLPGWEGSELRTLNVSLRGYRDEVLGLWQATIPAFQLAQPTQTLAGGANWMAITSGATGPLTGNTPFTPLPLVPPAGALTPMPIFTIAFAQTPPLVPAGGGPYLASLAGTLVLLPEDLGLTQADLQTPAGAIGGLVGISIGVVPTDAGVLQLRQDVTFTNDPMTGRLVTTITLTRTDPLSALTVQTNGVLSLLLPGFGTPKQLDGRLTIDSRERPPLVQLKDLFDIASPARLVLALDAAVAQNLLYDVIVGFTYALPLRTITPRSV